MNIAPYRQKALNGGVAYENFMKRSVKNAEGDALESYSVMNMTKLVLRETENEAQNEESFEILLSRIKENMMSAIENYLKFDLTDAERSEIETVKSKVAAARSSDILIAVIDRILTITERFHYPRYVDE